MDLDEFRSILLNSRVDVWEFIDTAISLASTDYPQQLKIRRDGIVERLYSNLNNNNNQPPLKHHSSPQSLPQHDDHDADADADDDVNPDPYGGLFDDDDDDNDEQTKILRIKQQLEDPNQTEDAAVHLLQTLADMDLTFTALKETDIGRHVNCLRKHPSNQVRRLVKHLVRKWKDLVDEWVGSNQGSMPPSNLTDGDSPLVQNVPRSSLTGGVHQGPDFGYSPNPHNGSSGSEPEQQQQQKPVVSKKPTPSRPAPPSRPAMVASASAHPANQPNREQNIESDRLASARKRLQENYQEAQNAKKQRTIQVMDIHEIPKPKNGFIAKNKGNFQGRHHR